jgi:hypothetical protein
LKIDGAKRNVAFATVWVSWSALNDGHLGTSPRMTPKKIGSEAMIVKHAAREAAPISP